MKRCAYCGLVNEDTAAVCSACGTSRFHNVRKTSTRRGIKFLIGGLLGGTALVVVFSVAFNDWTYLTRWLSGVVVIGLVAGYKLGRYLFISRAIHLAEQVRDQSPPKRLP